MEVRLNVDGNYDPDTGLPRGPQLPQVGLEPTTLANATSQRNENTKTYLLAKASSKNHFLDKILVTTNKACKTRDFADRHFDRDQNRI